MDGQSLRFRDPEHVRSVIDMLKTRDLSNEELSPRLRALGGGVLDDELESMVYVVSTVACTFEHRCAEV